MAVLLLKLGVCVVTLIHVTSSQSTYDMYDVTSCGRGTEQVLSQLQKDVAELKAAIGQLEIKGQSIFQTITNVLYDQELADAAAYAPSRRCVCTNQMAALFCVNDVVAAILKL